jgi:hypothetical protein
VVVMFRAAAASVAGELQQHAGLDELSLVSLKDHLDGDR